MDNLKSSRNTQLIAGYEYNRMLFLFGIGFVILLTIMFFLSKEFRVNRIVNNMNIYQNYTNIESMKLSSINDYTLGDFYVASSYNSALSGYQYLDYVSVEMIKKVLQTGVRFLEFQVFANNYNLDAVPIVSAGFRQGEWKLSLNTLYLEDVFKVLRDNAFRIYDGTDGSPNYKDPLFISLDLKTNGNYLINNKIQKLFSKYFMDYLLDPTFNYQAKNLATTPLRDLMGKIVVLSSDGFQGSNLEEIVNYSWAFSKLKRIHHSELVFEGSSQTLGSEVIEQKFKKGSITKEEYQQKLEEVKNNVQLSQLKDYNKNNLTIVVPHNEYDFITRNYDPKTAWQLGCQFVSMNFQSIDKNMDTYITMFKNRAFVLKPQNLRNNR